MCGLDAVRMWNRAAHQSNALVFDRSAAAAGLAARGASRPRTAFLTGRPHLTCRGQQSATLCHFFIEKEEVLLYYKNVLGVLAFKIFCIQICFHSKLFAFKIVCINNSLRSKSFALKIFCIQNFFHSKLFAFKIFAYKYFCIQNFLHTQIFAFKRFALNFLMH